LRLWAWKQSDAHLVQPEGAVRALRPRALVLVDALLLKLSLIVLDVQIHEDVLEETVILLQNGVFS
jgi:hypothetical protein